MTDSVADEQSQTQAVPQWGNSVLVEQVAVRSHGYNTLVAPLASQIKAAVATLKSVPQN